MIGIDTAPLTPVCPDMDKFFVPVSTRFCRQPVPLLAIYELVVKPCEGISIDLLKGMEKITAVMNHMYRAGLVEGLGLKRQHFKRCTSLAKQVQVFRLTRPESGMSLEKQADVLEQHFSDLLPVKNKYRCLG